MSGRKPLDATIDSVAGAIGLLWDWFGGPDPSTAIEKSKAERKLAREQRIPPIVVDTEGEEL